MAGVYRLQPALQRYAWGMTDVIESLVGHEPSGEPVAEAWWGAHASAPALATVDPHAAAVPLDAVIARDPRAMLGDAHSERWECLPYLLKVLAIARPLSLQVHPTLDQAQAGYADEDRRGTPVGDPRRTFKDRLHKPEMVVALTPMTLLTGFRPVAAVAQDLVRIGTPLTRRWATQLLDASTEPAVALRDYVAEVLHDPEAAGSIDALVAAGEAPGAPETLAIAAAAARQYPWDPGAFVAVALNVVHLAPREACFTGAGVIHSYQSGLGLEVMVNSDNVVRAGLTPKPIDVDLLIALTDGTPTPPPRVIPHIEGPVARYTAPVEEYALSLVEHGAATFPAGPRIVLTFSGSARLRSASQDVELARGEAAFAAAAEGEIEVASTGVAVVVEVPSPTR